jgi:hypothetical protein
MILRFITSLILSLSLLAPSANLYAAGLDSLEKFQDGNMGVNRSIARPISKYALKKMGTPGFLISKFMTYRKLMNNPVCTTSEKLTFVANLLTLAGDITNHVISFKNGRDLKKEFEGKSDKINNYIKSKADLLTAPKEKGDQQDIQMMSLDYSIKSNELELERLKMLRNFKNPALALFLIANILNAQEALSEASTMGAYTAAVNACKTAQTPITAAKEVATDTASDAGALAAQTAPKADTPWYIMPFMWIGEKLNALNDSAPVQALNTGRRGIKSNEANTGEYGGLGPLTSANYAEEMVVGIVESLKKEKKDSGLGDKVKDEVISIATRLLVRKAVKANVVAVDKFMRSSVGRTVVYSYNVWVMYTEFENLKGDIEDTKTKIAALKDVRASYANPSTVKINTKKFQKEFEDVFALVLSNLLASAHAAIPEPEAFGILKMCLENRDCSKVGDFLDPQVKKTFQVLPEPLRKEQFNFLKGSYSFAQVQAFNKGRISLQEINQDRVQTEIEKYEIEAERLANLLDKKSIVKKEKYQNFENLIVNEDYNWYAPALQVNFNQFKVASNNLKIPAKANEEVSTEATLELNNVSEEEKLAMAKKDEIAKNKFSLETEVKKVMESEFEFEDVHQNKSDDIWNIISKRYRNKF